MCGRVLCRGDEWAEWSPSTANPSSHWAKGAPASPHGGSDVGSSKFHHNLISGGDIVLGDGAESASDRHHNAISRDIYDGIATAATKPPKGHQKKKTTKKKKKKKKKTEEAQQDSFPLNKDAAASTFFSGAVRSVIALP